MTRAPRFRSVPAGGDVRARWGHLFRLVGLSAMVGFFAGLIHPVLGAVTLAVLGDAQWLSGALVLGVYGAFVGLVTGVVLAPVIVPLVWRAHPRRTVRVLSVAVALSSGIGLGVLGAMWLLAGRAAVTDPKGAYIGWLITAVFVQWCVLAAGLIVGAVWVRVRRAGRDQVLISVNCHHCGYDRTGLTPDALCPECGGTIGPRATA